MHAMSSSSFCGFGYQVFRQQSESAKIALQQRQHAGKVKAKEGVITSQLEAEEQAHQRAVAARKVLVAGHTCMFHANWLRSSKDMLSAPSIVFPGHAMSRMRLQKSIAC